MQRVVKATVRVENQTVGAIAQGLCVFVGVTHDDSFEESDQLVKKIVSLRMMDDENGVMNKSVVDADGEILIGSQLTLYGDNSKWRRPGWSAAAAPDHAEPLIERVVEGVKAAGVVVETGRFREHMQVELINDGPATLIASERLRGNISGLKQVYSNVSNSVSLLQTAEAALNEVSNMLIKIKQLTVHALNEATNSPDMLAADQQEIENLLSSIDRISQNTEFGGKRLLDGSMGSSGTAVGESLSFVSAEATASASSAKRGPSPPPRAPGSASDPGS